MNDLLHVLQVSGRRTLPLWECVSRTGQNGTDPPQAWDQQVDNTPRPAGSVQSASQLPCVPFKKLRQEEEQGQGSRVKGQATAKMNPTFLPHDTKFPKAGHSQRQRCTSDLAGASWTSQVQQVELRPRDGGEGGHRRSRECRPGGIPAGRFSPRQRRESPADRCSLGVDATSYITVQDLEARESSNGPD